MSPTKASCGWQQEPAATDSEYTSDSDVELFDTHLVPELGSYRRCSSPAVVFLSSAPERALASIPVYYLRRVSFPAAGYHYSAEPTASCNSSDDDIRRRVRKTRRGTHGRKPQRTTTHSVGGHTTPSSTLPNDTGSCRLLPTPYAHGFVETQWQNLL